MLLTITNERTPATDLGYLLHKSPERLHSFSLAYGKAHIFYPEATPERCTVALLLEIDPIGLVRNRRGPSGDNHSLEHYVNDRPYVASSFLSVALARVLGTAMAGKSKHRAGLVDEPLPLTAKLAVIFSRGGEEAIRKLFAPLGYEVKAERHPLDENFPEWGQGPYYALELRKEVTVRELLNHLYVLIPVLDPDKHYWVGDDEVDKLLRKGEGWLKTHPERDYIVRRYLKRRGRLTRMALARLVDETPDPDAELEKKTQQEEEIEKPLKLHEQRLNAVAEKLKEAGAQRVVDLGCGEGKLLRALLKEKQFKEIFGMDVSYRSLEIAADRLKLETMPPTQKKRIQLVQGSLMYRDKRIAGFDGATVVEVIEHLDEPRLAAFERVLFDFAKPSTVVITTPNSEYNVKFETLPAGQMRHKDHRFEWTRAQFQDWATALAARYGYTVSFFPIGDEDQVVGAPSQMGVFQR
ncbi:Methyltransferase type 12 [Candidatus Koribacter versatilis Ellin345]|uniref:Small RNA 2'-O-methyltransferase n=2 Tax=Candidatus Korobacter versatilis TaxID=658062 RepID=Q1IQ73_KORVE|nr:Methyltransferase type 12 [Candidatus Koribacter versatilis Ellin345]